LKRFAALFRTLDRSTGTGDKRAALVAYFRQAPPDDAAWALYLLSGGKITGARARIASTGELREWIAPLAGVEDWLVADSYDHVGDLAETLALLLDDPAEPAPDVPLSTWIEQRLLPMANAPVEQRRAVVEAAWRSLDFEQRLLFNKLLTGALRVGVSQRLVQQALAELSGIDIARIAQRMLGAWRPSAGFLETLLSPEVLETDRQQPYPFFLASPLEGEPDTLGDIAHWQLEWKWDGIRLQLIRRGGEVALWSRGEERLDGRFPEIERAAAPARRHGDRRRTGGLAHRRGAPAAIRGAANAHPAPAPGAEDVSRCAGAGGRLRPAGTRGRGSARTTLAGAPRLA